MEITTNSKAGPMRAQDHNRMRACLRTLAGVIACTVVMLSSAAGSDLTAYRRSDYVNSVVYQSGFNAHLLELYLTGGAWYWGDLNEQSGAPGPWGGTAAYIRSDGVNCVVYVGADSHIYELSLTGGSWHFRDLTATGAPLAGGTAAVYVRSDHVNAVVYPGVDHHIYELSSPTGASWSAADLTTRTGAPLANGNPTVYARSDGVNSVLYIGAYNHVYEMYLTSGMWRVGDLTVLTGAAPATGFAVSPYVRSDRVNAVVYLGTYGASQHIYELSFSGGAWHVGDLSLLTGAPAPGAPHGGSGWPAAYARSDGTNSVVYLGADNHIYELYLAPGMSWRVDDLSTIAHAQQLAGGNPAAYVRSDGVNSVVYRGLLDNNVYELYLSGGVWRVGNLTAITGAPVARPQ